MTAELTSAYEQFHVIIDNPPAVDRCLYRTTFKTIQLNANLQFSELLSGPDPQRCSVVIVAIDAPVVLCDKSQANTAPNLATGLTNPSGSIIPVNVAIPIPTQTEIWIACPLTGLNINRVSVITTHKVPM
jgi:hypothetical protein